MYSRDLFASPGAVFRLTEAGLLAKLEQMAQSMPDQFTINETAGIHQLYMLGEAEVDPLMCLEQHYQSAIEKRVAA